MIHVTFSSSGAGSLRQALRISGERLKVVDIAHDLSWGPIMGTDFVERQGWLSSNLPWDAEPQHDDYWNWISSGAHEFQNKLESTDEHLVWVAPQNASELCGLHWYLDHFGGGKAAFVLVDHALPKAWKGQRPHGFGELGPEQFEFLLENADREAWDQGRFPRDRWAQLRNEATNLRIVNQGIATSVADDHFDDALLAKCCKEWRKLSRVIASAMIAQWDAHHFVGDSFWLWRLRELASQGKIIASREIVYGANPSKDPIFVRLGD